VDLNSANPLDLLGNTKKHRFHTSENNTLAVHISLVRACKSASSPEDAREDPAATGSDVHTWGNDWRASAA